MIDIAKNKIIIFDIGGTLMKYVDMPLSWADYYQQGFEAVNSDFSLNLSDNQINKSVEIMKSYNPRINYREIEIAPTVIFKEATEHWQCNIDIRDIINSFFRGLNLKTRIFDYSLPMLNALKREGFVIGLLTDLPNGMPDELFKNEIKDIIDTCDFYISSQSCGYRKPNSYAINTISQKYNVRLKEILFVGDEEKDRKTAENAGCNFMWAESFITDAFN